MPASRTTQAPPFNLTRWFSWVSLLCIGAISAGSALLLSNFLMDKMLHRDAVLSMEFVQAMVLADRAAAYFLAGEASGSAKDLEETFKHFAQMPDVLRANVYARDRSIAWSSDKSLIGKKFADNEELDEALAAELVVNSGVMSKEEHVVFQQSGVRYFIETYVPLWDHDHKNVIGVVELYRTPDALFEAIHNGQRLIWACAILGGAFLYAALFWIVRRADGTMREQQRRLIETETLTAIGEMASAVAHGIRNPLASIRTSAELTLDSHDDTTRECAQDIIAAVDRTERWVRELLSFSRPVAGGADTIELNPVVRNSAETYAREMAKREIALTLQLDDRLPAVRGNASMLGQVINSLITNAIDAMSARGRLAITSRLAGPSQVEVCIIDTGSGIKPHDIAAVLKPFHTTKAKGLGLGLPLAKRIVERYGGTLAIASTHGEGTTVTLRLSAA